MKKILIFLLAATAAASSFAQTKGQAGIGGCLGFSFDQAFEGNYYANLGGSFNIGVGAKYFVIDNVAVKADLAYLFRKDNDARPGIATTNTANFAVGANYYLKLCKRFYWTPGLTLYDSFGVEKKKLSTKAENWTRSDINTFGINLDIIRFEFIFNEHFSIYGNCGDFGFTTTDYNHARTINSWKMDLSSLLKTNIGFTYWF